jgi:hypothetical protein
MLAVEDSHVRELFRRHCYTNFTTLLVRSMCVSDEHYLASLMASYGLDNTTDCKVSPKCRMRLLWSTWCAICCGSLSTSGTAGFGDVIMPLPVYAWRAVNM